VSATRWSPPRRVVALDGALPDAAATRRHVAEALGDEPGAVLVRPAARTRALLAELPGVPVVAVLPDLAQLLRDVGERGAPRAAASRLVAGGIAGLWRLARTGLRHVRDLARQEFRGIVPVLIELERGGVGGARPEAVALAAPLTDLLLAAENAECLAHVVSCLRRSGVRAGFETQNLGHLLPRLMSWGVEPDFAIGPLNARGYRMKPTPSAVLDAVRRSATPVLASEVTAAGTVPLAEAVAQARERGAAGVVLSLGELGCGGGSA
jgi:hypothetical protein